MRRGEEGEAVLRQIKITPFNSVARCSSNPIVVNAPLQFILKKPFGILVYSSLDK